MATLADAQIAKWLIEPAYDKMYMAIGTDAIVTDSSDVKTLWSYNGERMIETTDALSAFRENRSIATIPETTEISFILKDNGETLNIGNCDVALDYPYYSCGKLLVREGSYFRYVDKEGLMGVGKYLIAYPYFNDYASCQTYVNMEKQNERRNLLLNKDEVAVQFVFDGKMLNPKDVEFVSSVNDEGIAVVVINHKVFLFHGENVSLSPVYASENEATTKNQAKLNGNFADCYTRIDDDGYKLIAKCGKNNFVSFEFDGMLRPTTFSSNNTVKKYNARAKETKEYSSPLRISKDGDLRGIVWDSEEMLPPQFDDVSMCFGNKSIVKLKGKYGLLEIDKDSKFSIKINKGDDVAFLHQKKETPVRVDMPTFILSDKTYLEIDPACGLELDKTSREKKNTESGNFVEYKCILNIPGGLQDEIEVFEYPIQILYNGLKAPVVNHKVNEWFYKKFEVEEDESLRNVENGTLTFVFNIKNVQMDDMLVKFDVSVLTDSLRVEREDKLSETRYKYKVYDLNEGVNNIVVQVLEQGCPPASFSFEVEYHKPVVETETTKAEEETVTIKKKPRIRRADQEHERRLEI